METEKEGNVYSVGGESFNMALFAFKINFKRNEDIACINVTNTGKSQIVHSGQFSIQTS